MKLHQELDPTEGVPVGRDPRRMTVAELEALGHRKRRILQAVRERCIDCCAGNVAEVRRCGISTCAAWPYRMGTNPFAAEQSPERRAAAAERGRALRSQQLKRGADSGSAIPFPAAGPLAATTLPAGVPEALALAA